MDWLTQAKLNELKSIMLEDYGLTMTDDEIKDLGENLVLYFDRLNQKQDRKFELPSRSLDLEKKKEYVGTAS